MKIKIIDTKNVPTIEIQLDGKNTVFHSKYNPIKEASDWTKNALKFADTSNELIVIGLAAGYHLQALSAAVKEANITVLEFNSSYYKWFQSSHFYKGVYQLPNVALYDIKKLTDNKRESIFKNLHSNNILIQKNALEIFPKEYENIKDILKDFHIQKNSFMNQAENMFQNFSKNIALADKGIKVLKNYYKGKTMLLISAGPSLDKQLSFLKIIFNERKILIGSVGTAVKSLLKIGIIPDFMMITDPNEGTLFQLEGVNLSNTPLFYLSTAYHETIVLHKGPRYIVFQEGYDKAEELGTSNKDPLIKTGGSVSTTLLDLMIYLGASNIGLVGQDLAYTSGLTHANSTPLQRTVKEETGLMEVWEYYQKKQVSTSKNLMIYKKWFEKYAEQKQHVHLYNCTEGGAFIENWNHIDLKEFYNIFSENN